MKICEKCGKEYTVSMKDNALRRLVSVQARLFPALKDLIETAANYCNECWKDVVKPAAETALTGIRETEDETNTRARDV